MGAAGDEQHPDGGSSPCGEGAAGSVRHRVAGVPTFVEVRCEEQPVETCSFSTPRRGPGGPVWRTMKRPWTRCLVVLLSDGRPGAPSTADLNVVLAADRLVGPGARGIGGSLSTASGCRIRRSRVFADAAVAP